MNPTQPTHALPRAARRGLSILELMISLSISTFLLVAVAVAYNASADAVEMNDKFFRAMQSGRITMNQLLTEVRRADSVVVADAGDSVIVTRPPADRSHPEEQSREFKYDPATRRITLQIFYKKADGTTYQSAVYGLASNIASAKFGPPDKVKNTAGHWIDVRIPVALEVKIGSNQVRLDGSSSPRRLSVK